ncbi:MAG: zinc-ribbon domain-containing protein [Methanobacteriaceae archaeon]|nr:zinc-ribbon domain-containing protein [Candidatus Methanorudis spinitermitis]
MTKYCSNCGEKNDENSTFCKNCGKRLSELHTVNTKDNNSSTNNKEKILIGIVIIIVIAIAIAGAVAFILLDNNKDNDLLNNVNLDNNNNNVATITTSTISLSEVYGLASAFSNELKYKSIQEISSIEYKGVTFTKQQCLYIFAKAIDMKSKDLDGTISFKSFDPPESPLNGVSTNYLTKSEYVDMAQRTCNWMDNNGLAPNYTGIVVAGSPDFGYDGLVIAFCIVILDSEKGSLPPSINW